MYVHALVHIELRWTLQGPLLQRPRWLMKHHRIAASLLVTSYNSDLLKIILLVLGPRHRMRRDAGGDGWCYGDNPIREIRLASLGNPREFKKPNVSICLYKYTRIIIYIYIFEIWHLFEFIVFVQWFLYCWIRGSWRPYDQEVSVASLTLPDNLMRRLMRTGTVKGGELMTSGLNEGDLIARPYLSDDGWV